MVKIVVAFASGEKCERCSSALEAGGIPVFRKCTSASEVKRVFNQCGGGILIAACRLPDATIDQLAWDLGKEVVIMAVGRAGQIDLCEHPDIFRLVSPCSKGELISAVNMLIQLYQMRLPRRTAEDKEIITRAKVFLARQYGMTEPEAHCYLQREAMNRGVKLTELAQRLLEINEKTPG